MSWSRRLRCSELRAKHWILVPGVLWLGTGKGAVIVGMSDYELAIRLMAEHDEIERVFAGPQPDRLIMAAEFLLEISYPAIYRRFLRDFGAGNFGSFEIYGIIIGPVNQPGPPNGVWLTRIARNEGDISPTYVVIATDGMGGYYCLNCSSDARTATPVIVVDPAGPQEVVAPDFGVFLLDGVRDEIRRHAKRAPSESLSSYECC